MNSPSAETAEVKYSISNGPSDAADLDCGRFGSREAQGHYKVSLGAVGSEHERLHEVHLHRGNRPAVSDPDDPVDVKMSS